MKSFWNKFCKVSEDDSDELAVSEAPIAPEEKSFWNEFRKVSEDPVNPEDPGELAVPDVPISSEDREDPGGPCGPLNP